MFVAKRRRHVGRGLKGAASGLLMAMFMTQACGGAENRPEVVSDGNSDGRATRREEVSQWRREKMVELQLRSRGIENERVLAAMERVPRHRFVPDLDPARAYDDRPHSIGEGQTISQPYIVALMSELARVEPPCKVLEIGTGSGYQAAVLAEMGCEVYTIELIESLGLRARRILDEEGYGDRVPSRIGDGYSGWPEFAPYDAVVVTAAAPRIPQPLLDQLRIGGRLVIPVGDLSQQLEVHTRREDGIERESIIAVRFVPMKGEVREVNEPR